MKNIILLFIFFSFTAGAEPTIHIKPGEVGILQLGPDVTAALNKFNAKFKIYGITDFSEEAAELYSAPKSEVLTGDCEQRTPPSVKALPFAVTGDFNGDGKEDAVVLGRDEREQLLLGVLSSANSYRVVVIEKSARALAPSVKTALSLVESAAKAKKIDYYVVCLPPTVKRFKNDAILVGELMSNSQRLYHFNGSAFVKSRE